jgi:hypothetical protein
LLAKFSLRAHELDIWLHENVGRPYIAILGWGLVFSIFESLRSLSHTLAENASGVFSMIKLLLILAFQAGLLINQLAQWHQHRQRHGRKRPGRGVEPPPAPRAEP